MALENIVFFMLILIHFIFFISLKGPFEFSLMIILGAICGKFSPFYSQIIGALIISAHYYRQNKKDKKEKKYSRFCLSCVMLFVGGLISGNVYYWIFKTPELLTYAEKLKQSTIVLLKCFLLR